MITITRMYDDYSTAARAYNDLDRAGISTDDISIVASNGDGWFEKGATEPGKIDRDGDGTDDRNEGAAKGAGIGGAVGGVTGLLAGLGLLAIPGLGASCGGRMACFHCGLGVYRRSGWWPHWVPVAAWRQRRRCQCLCRGRAPRGYPGDSAG